MTATDQFISILNAIQLRMIEEIQFGERVHDRRIALGMETAEKCLNTTEGRLLLLQSVRVIGNVEKLLNVSLEACDAALQAGVDAEVVSELKAKLELARSVT